MTFARGELEGHHPITDDYVNKNTKYKDVTNLSKLLVAGSMRLSDLKGAKPVIRLHPPIGGYEGIKRSYVNGGALGYRGKDINRLLLRMIEEED